jgi:hypothetical protein
MSKFLRNVVDEIWYNNFKNSGTFYTKVTTIDIMALLDANSRGLYALGMISLHTDMMQYYMQADGIPRFIVMMEDARNKANWTGMPIANVELVMMASAAVLAAQHFPHEVDNQEGLPAASCMWQAWKVAFCLAHLKRQHQHQALGGGKPLGSVHTVIPTAEPTIDCIGAALKNLALAALNDTTILQQLTAANLALMASVTSLMAANKKLLDALARNKGSMAPAAAPATGKGCLTPEPHECNLWKQGRGTQGQSNERQHDGQ